MEPLTMAAMAAGGAALGLGEEVLIGNYRRKKQLEQQQKLTNIQTEANKSLARYGMGISKEMWDYTNYENQRKHMEAAGLNPALMYGSAGQGGTTSSASAGSASGGMASDSKQGMGLDGAMIASQIRVNEAQAKKLDAEAEKTSGVDTELAKKSIEDITATIDNKGVQKLGMLLQNNYDEMRNEILEDTKDLEVRDVMFRVKRNAKLLEQANKEIDNLQLSNEEKQKYLDNLDKQIELTNKNLAADYLLKVAQGQLTREQASIVVRDFGVRLSQLGANLDENTIKREMNEIIRDNNITTAGTNLTQALTTTILGALLLRSGRGAKPIKGFTR